MFHAVIMAGGSGTRLWPLSRETQPKQTLKLVGDQSMYQRSVARLAPIFPSQNVWVVTRKSHAPLLQHQAPDVGVDRFIIEPQGRGTAPAIGLAAIHLNHHDPEAVMAVLTADHFIQDEERFRAALIAAKAAAEKDQLVTFGIPPTSPSTAYGYIEAGAVLEPENGFNTFRVRQFTEKPSRDMAARMVSSGLYSWNSGMFIWKVKRILEEFERQMPELYNSLMEVAPSIGSSNYATILDKAWANITTQTIDYGIMEGAKDVVVIPVEMGWSDIGSWASLADMIPPDEKGNIIAGDYEGLDTNNTIVFGSQRLIATIGVKDLVIVDTQDALLVCARGSEQKAKELVEQLKRKGRDDLL